MLAEEVRAHCAAIAAGARHVTIHPGATRYDDGVAGLDPTLHRLDAGPEEVARYVLILDTINFGSGWFDELQTDTNELTRRLSDRGTPWTAAELRALPPTEVGDVLGLDPAHELTGLYATALQQLGGWLGARRSLDFGTSAQALAAELAAALPFFDDPGFYKRAQITANDLTLAGVADFGDIDRLTAFADNLLPHVLRHDGVLEYSDALAAAVDGGEELPPGSAFEVELRACAVHACEGLAARAGVPPRTLDNWLWNRGMALGGRPHRTRTVAY